MKKFIKNYIELINKYILVKVGTILLIVMLLAKIATVVNETVNRDRINQNSISKYNTYSSETLTVEDVAQRYFYEYTGLLQYDIELAYEKLEENCKNKYADVNEFKNYIQKFDFTNIEISNYSVVEDEEQRKYIVDDNINNVYSFIIESPNEYNVIIDKK